MYLNLNSILSTPDARLPTHREDLEKSITDERKEIFEKYMDNRNEYDYLAQAEIFEYGFRLRAQLMMDALKEQ